MAYTPPLFTEFVWQDAPSTATPLKSSNLLADENNLATYIQSVIIDYDTYARATFATQGNLPGQIANSAYWLSGTAASRPSASAVSTGSFYRASNTGVVSVSDGLNWHLVSTETLGVPIGAIEQYGGSTDPVDADGTSRWLICDGRAISRSTYSSVFSVLGTTYGVGNGTTTFNLPDMRQRFPLGKAVAGTGSTLGTAGGSVDHNHTLPGLSVPALSTTDHTHTLPGLSVPALTTPAHTHTVPGLSVPGLSVPGLSVPGLAIGSHTHTTAAHTHSTPGHSHPLSTAGGARIIFQYLDSGTVYQGDWGPVFNTVYYSNTALGTTSFVGSQNSTGLVGNTDSGGVSTTGSTSAGNTGAASGTTSTGTTGTGTTGTGTTGTGTSGSGGSGVTGTGTTGSGTSGLGGSGVTGTGTTGTGTSGTSNPPYLVVNFIIRVL